MRVQLTRTVTIVGGAEDGGDVTYSRDAEYDVPDAIGKSLVECGQAVALTVADKKRRRPRKALSRTIEGEAKAILAAFENKRDDADTENK